MRRALAAAALLAAAVTFASAQLPGAEPAEAADCVPVQHSKTVVKKKKVRRHGKLVKVKRKKVVRWTTCDPVPAPSTCAEPSSSLGVVSLDMPSRFNLSRPCVSAGQVSIQLNNTLGDDPHNLFLKPGTSYGDGVAAYKLPVSDPFQVEPGDVDSAAVALTPGDWYLWCDLLTHRVSGMEAVLQVR